MDIIREFGWIYCKSKTDLSNVVEWICKANYNAHRIGDWYNDYIEIMLSLINDGSVKSMHNKQLYIVDNRDQTYNSKTDSILCKRNKHAMRCELCARHDYVIYYVFKYNKTWGKLCEICLDDMILVAKRLIFSITLFHDRNGLLISFKMSSTFCTVYVRADTNVVSAVK